MTAAEKIAYEAGKTAKERGLGDKAPCFDPILDSLLRDARSKSGHAYNSRVLRAWFMGAGRDIPTE